MRNRPALGGFFIRGRFSLFLPAWHKKLTPSAMPWVMCSEKAQAQAAVRPKDWQMESSAFCSVKKVRCCITGNHGFPFVVFTADIVIAPSRTLFTPVL